MLPTVAHMSHSTTSNHLGQVVRDALGEAGLLTEKGKASREADRRTGVSRATLDRLFVSGDFKPQQLAGIAAALGTKGSALMALAEQRTAA
jgi:lambda repressor-like predicted transcriptional regulator